MGCEVDQVWAEHVELALPRPTGTCAAMPHDRIEPFSDMHTSGRETMPFAGAATRSAHFGQSLQHSRAPASWRHVSLSASSNAD
jgi:hypothetical protein